MSQIELNKVKKAIDGGRVANTYLMVGRPDSNVLGSSFELIKSIIKSPYSNLEIPKQQAALEKLKSLTNPDIHYYYPVNTTGEVKTKASSEDFIEQWREIVLTGTKIKLTDWYDKIGLGNKQAVINKDEAEKITRLVSLKSYEGGVKIFLIWMVEKMNISASNKLLKLLEEPPPKTIFILVCEQENKLLDTIKSRCQKIFIRPQIVEQQEVNSGFEILFLEWVRAAFKVRGKKSAINELVRFAEKVSKKTREEQKSFLIYCSDVIRDSMLYGYRAENKKDSYKSGLDLEKFAPFVHEENILDFYKEIQKGFSDIERNGNPKIIFLDISVKLTRLLHVKPAENV
tara:strand:+ start:1212 stop:2240 length:1029 start_codon:yes stop_codon:yes gene_type:complete